MASLTSRSGKKLKDDAQEQDDTSSSIRLSKLKRHVELRQLLVLVGVFAVVSSGLFLFFILFRDNYSSVTTPLPNQSAELSDEKLQAIRGMLLEEATPATMYRYNPEHLGVAPPDSHYYHQPDRPPRLAQTAGAHGYSFVWKTAQLNQDTYSASKSSPAIQGDLVYIGTDRTTLAAVSRLTGQVCKHQLRAFSLSLSLFAFS